MVEAPKVQVTWARYYRLINSAYPPIDLFEDIADPEDWLLLGFAESRTNARLNPEIGNLDMVPQDRRVGGEGASYVMAPFTHLSPDCNNRFNDGSFGAFYAANRFETALFEVRHHMQKFYAATREAKGWLTDFRELIGSVDAELVDINGVQYKTVLGEDYEISQQFAKQCLKDGADGILYPSVRDPEGQCFAAFYPDVMSIPKQGNHLTFHWDGARINLVKLHDDGTIYEVED